MTKELHVPTLRAWRYMRRLCYDASHPTYPRVGGRGVRVCERWDSYENFLADMGKRPEGWGANSFSVGRLDESADFTVENSRWMTRSERLRRSGSARPLTAGGVTRSRADWAESAGLTPSGLASRLRRGMTLEEALAAPVLKTRARRLVSFGGVVAGVVAQARKAGLPPAAVSQRLRLGWTEEEALTLPCRPYRSLVEHGGELLTLSQWAARTGLPLTTLRYRLRAGWPTGLALTTPVRRRNSNVVMSSKEVES